MHTENDGTRDADCDARFRLFFFFPFYFLLRAGFTPVMHLSVVFIMDFFSELKENICIFSSPAPSNHHMLRSRRQARDE